MDCYRDFDDQETIPDDFCAYHDILHMVFAICNLAVDQNSDDIMDRNFFAGAKREGKVTMSNLVCPATLSVGTDSSGKGYEVIAFCEKRKGHWGNHMTHRPTDRRQWVQIEWDIDSGHFCEFCGNEWSPEHHCGE